MDVDLAARRIVPFQLTTNGVRIPPSVNMPFSPNIGALSEPSQGPSPSGLVIPSGAPLSLMTKIRRSLFKTVLAQCCHDPPDAIIDAGDCPHRLTAVLRHRPRKTIEIFLGRIERDVRRAEG